MVQNLTWDSNASQRGLEKAANKVSNTIDKGISKISTDMQRNTDKITTAFKSGMEKVTDTIGRIKTTNESGNNQTAPVAAICQGLKSIAVATARTADHARTHPTALHAILESARAVSENFAKLVADASSAATSSDTLRATTAETIKASDWIGSKYLSDEDNVFIGNAFGRLSDFS